ncbi:mechanosensitive ion channel family protein [Bowmanella sp. Y26]|uniref:Small-conductance mechanosensitive channel n=1 Tax=Bowmanella yangjiangensis TaxID=2811230 RepID=A0ABS3CXF8_9ALTE|nr:mechanosensitive ion channel domain-containing protein [Bowmanella yangjiangensis]MBN7821803.1 mechanosensitive ion channel [Bowmanella yangjiangensis]MBT1063485.1 mechanosensitive ion channel family protein [Bowmanella yangjiangensis]
MQTKILILLALLALFFISRTAIQMFVQKVVEVKDASLTRKAMIKKFLYMAHLGVFLFAAVVTMGIDYANLMVFLSSTFAILGVALVAQWSILANITAGILIFFNFPYRVGDRVMIVNKDFDMSGVIEEITTFHVLIRRDQGELITYPNSLILQTPVIKVPDGVPRLSGKTEQLESD